MYTIVDSVSLNLMSLNGKSGYCRVGNIYARKWWYFTLIFFVLGLISGDQDNVSAPLSSSNSLHRKFGETVPTLYPRAFIFLGYI